MCRDLDLGFTCRAERIRPFLNPFIALWRRDIRLYQIFTGGQISKTFGQITCCAWEQSGCFGLYHFLKGSFSGRLRIFSGQKLITDELVADEFILGVKRERLTCLKLILQVLVAHHQPSRLRPKGEIVMLFSHKIVVLVADNPIIIITDFLGVRCGKLPAGRGINVVAVVKITRYRSAGKFLHGWPRHRGLLGVLVKTQKRHKIRAE